VNEPTGRPRRQLLILIGIVAAPAVLLVLAALISTLRSELILVEVPVGTSARIEAGEAVELMPGTLEVSVGDTLEIRNLDVAGHDVGPYHVAAGQTVRQTFTAPGTIRGLCTLHPSGEVTIVVR
jgi:plastocyanin